MDNVYLLTKIYVLLWLNLIKWNKGETFLTERQFEQRRTRTTHSFGLDSNLTLTDKIQNLKKALEYVGRLNATNCENGTADSLALRLDRAIWDTYANVAIKTANFLSKYLQINTVNGSFPHHRIRSFQEPNSERDIDCSNRTRFLPQFNIPNQLKDTLNKSSITHEDIDLLMYLLVQNNIDTDSPVIFGSAIALEPFVVPCVDKYSPYAYKMSKDNVYVEDLSLKYNYLASTVQWYSSIKSKIKSINIKRKTVKQRDTDQSLVTYTYAEATLSNGHWTNPYFDCGGGNVWMVTFSAPILWINLNNTICFRGVATVDIHLTNIDINQCDQEVTRKNENVKTNDVQSGDEAKNIVDIFRGTHSCQATTECVHVPMYGFRRGSYRCVCKNGFYFPFKNINHRYFNGSEIEDFYATNQDKINGRLDAFRCLPCARLCDTCNDSTPCMYQSNSTLRISILTLSSLTLVIILLLAAVICYIRHQLVIKSASPVFLLTMCFGSVIMSFEVFIHYLEPNNFLCKFLLWPKHLGFAIMYGSLILKTWRISMIFKVGKVKRVKLPDKILLQRLVPMVLATIVGLSACTIKTPSRALLLVSSTSMKYIGCSTNHWNYVFYSMESLILLYGVYLCFTIRKVPAFFNESRYITWSTYNALIFGSFLNIFTQFVKTYVGPDITYLLNFLSIQISGTVTVVLIFLPKFYALYKIHRGQMSNSEAISTVTGRVLSHVIPEIDLQDKSSQTYDNQCDEQCQCQLSMGSQENVDYVSNSTSELPFPSGLQKPNLLVAPLKKFHKWKPHKKNQIMTVQEDSIAERSNNKEITLD